MQPGVRSKVDPQIIAQGEGRWCLLGVLVSVPGCVSVCVSVFVLCVCSLSVLVCWCVLFVIFYGV